MSKTYKEKNGTYYSENTSDDLVNILESIRNSGTRVRLDYGFTDSHDDVINGKEGVFAGLSWGEEYDIEGTIGRSTGEIKILLLIARSSSMGGGGISDDCIVQIRETNSGRLIYQHPNYTPAYDWKNHNVINEEEYPEYPFSLEVKDNRSGKKTVQSRFKTAESLKRYINKRVKYEKPAKLTTKKNKSKSAKASI